MEAVFLKIFNMSLTASWLVLAVILLRLLLKKAPKWVNGVLWAFVALRLIFPFSIESVLSLIPSAQTLPNDFIYTAEPAITSGVPIINSAVNPVIAQSLSPAPGASANPTQIFGFIAAVVWLVGVCAMLLYMLISYILLRIKVGERVLDGGNIYLCDKIPTPFIMGIIRPKIYLPSDISDEDKKYVLSHEKAHIRRGDHLWKPLGFILLAVYWFNPILWVAYILLCRDIELACDERVIKSLGEDVKKPYSLALINYSSPRRMISACPLAFGEVGVKERVKRILNYKKPAFWIVLVSLIAITVTAVCLLTNPVSTICIEDIDEPFSIKGMLDSIEKINYSNVDTMTVTDSDEVAAILLSLKDMRIKSKPLPPDEESSNFRGCIELSREGGSVYIEVPGYDPSDGQMYEQNAIRIRVDDVESGVYAVVDTNVLEEIVGMLKSQPADTDSQQPADSDTPQEESASQQPAAPIKPVFEYIHPDAHKYISLDPDTFKDFELTSVGMTYWDPERYETANARIHRPQLERLQAILDGISLSESKEYMTKQRLFDFFIRDNVYHYININFYNSEYDRCLSSAEELDGERYAFLTDVHNIDDVCIYISALKNDYYSIDDPAVKEALIKLLIEMVDDSGSPLNRLYGMDKLVCANPYLSFCPTPDNTPAYGFNSNADSKANADGSTSFWYNMYTIDGGKTAEIAKLPAGSALREIDLSSAEYDSLFANSLHENGYSVSQFRSPENRAYYIESESTDYIFLITPEKEYYLAMIPDKRVDWILRLKDIMPYNQTVYMDHVFYDIDGDGVEEACCVSGVQDYQGYGVSPVYITARRDGRLAYCSRITPPADMYMAFKKESDRLTVIGKEKEGSKQHNYVLWITDYILNPATGNNSKQITLFGDGRTLPSNPMVISE